MSSRLRSMAVCLAASVCAATAAAQASDTATPELYRAKCEQCHLADGSSPLEPLNFADGKWKNGSKPEEVARAIAEGVPGSAMLAFKSQLTPEQIAELAAYVRSFDKSLKPAKRRK